MPDADDHRADNQPHAGGFTLDLSTGKPAAPSAPKRKGAVPVVQQTVNLSTSKPEAAPEPPAEPTKPKPERSKGKGGGRPRSGSTLADLLDPETLARLRGEG